MPKERKIYFVRYKYMFSSGTDENWSYHEFVAYPENVDECVEDYVEGLASEYEYSEHFRKIEYEIILRPPDNVLDNIINHAHKKREYLNERITLLEELKNEPYTDDPLQQIH